MCVLDFRPAKAGSATKNNVKWVWDVLRRPKANHEMMRKQAPCKNTESPPQETTKTKAH